MVLILGQNRKRAGSGRWILFILGMVGAYILLCRADQHFYRSAYIIEYEQLVYQEAERQSLSPALVFAVIRTESGFNPYAQSSASARGLMQITKETFDWAKMRMGEQYPLDFDDLFRTEVNIRYGTAILRLLMDDLETEENTLCGYHAGRSKTLEWLSDPTYSPNGQHVENIPYADTRGYVEKVMQTKRIYEKLYTM